MGFDFDQAFKQAFPPKAKMPPYDFSTATAGMARDVTTMPLQTGGASIQASPGSLGQINARTVESQQLVTQGPTVSNAPGTMPAESSQGRRDWDPHGDFNFSVEIDGKSVGAFAKCDGLSFEMDVIEYRDGMDPYPRYRPGIRRFGRIRLTKGYVDNTELWDWCQDIIHGKHDRRHGAVHLRNDDGSTAMTYRFIDAFPVKWSGFKFDGKGQGTTVEEIELVTECVIRD